METTQQIPLTMGEDGTIRIANSRVTLESVIHEFKLGASAEQIQEDFPSVPLRDLYSVVAHYLSHVEEVEEYLRAQKREEGQVRAEIEGRVEAGGLRRRLRDLRAQGTR
jgi:uncharacterized protein (DUF433 family)